jgi:hypothetical protein
MFLNLIVVVAVPVALGATPRTRFCASANARMQLGVSMLGVAVLLLAFNLVGTVRAGSPGG